MKNRLRRALFMMAAVPVALVIGVACGGQNDDIPLFFAAASLADVLTNAAEVYEEETGDSVEFNFGGSTALANQVAKLGAPADGIILAGQGPVDLLVSKGLVITADVSIVARNSLVVVSEDAVVLNSLSDLAGSGVAIADPGLAPAGQYAREALISAGAWDSLDGKIVPTLDVRAALAAVSSGSVDFAIVYATDALTEPDVNVVLSIDPALHRPVVYQAAVITGTSAISAAMAFLDFLLSADGQRVFREHGFLGR